MRTDFLAMTQRAFIEARSHWAFPPAGLLLLTILVYVAVFSDNGFLAYRETLNEKQKIEYRIAELRKRKTELTDQLGTLKDEGEATRALRRNIYVLDEKVRILKFVDTKGKEEEENEEAVDVRFWQSVYLAASLPVFLVFSYLSYRYHRRQRESL